MHNSFQVIQTSRKNISVKSREVNSCRRLQMDFRSLVIRCRWIGIHVDRLVMGANWQKCHAECLPVLWRCLRTKFNSLLTPAGRLVRLFVSLEGVPAGLKSAVDEHQAFKGKLQTFVDEHQATVDRLGTTVGGQGVRLHQYQPFADGLVTLGYRLLNSCRMLGMPVRRHKMIVSWHKTIVDCYKTTVSCHKMSVICHKMYVRWH